MEAAVADRIHEDFWMGFNILKCGDTRGKAQMMNADLVAGCWRFLIAPTFYILHGMISKDAMTTTFSYPKT